MVIHLRQTTQNSLFLFLILGLTGICNGAGRNVSITGTRPQTRQNGCNYQFSFTASGQTANLDSPNYPNDYPGNIDCKYQITSPVGTKMTMRCDEFNVESSTNCQYDKFYMSLTGRLGSEDETFICGRGVLDRTSVSNKLAIGFRTDDSNPTSTTPFNFRCKIMVIDNPGQPSCSCGFKNQKTRIVGGQDAGQGEYPWRCVLYSQGLGAFCGCTIISNNFVLTAAHCTSAVPHGEIFYVNVGDHDLTTVDEANNEVIRVARVIQNSNYNNVTQDSDTALLQLDRPLVFTRDVQPICLPFKYRGADFSGIIVTATGWGTTSYGGGQASVLQEVDLNVYTTQQCKAFYPTSLTDNMLCTYTSGKDTCQGDSGGSIDYNDPDTGRSYAIGVVSWGVGCAGKNKPGVYAKLTNFLDWIEVNTGDSFCKV